MIRGLFIAAFFFIMTPLLIAVQWLLDHLGLPGWGAIATGYYRVLCKILHIRIHVNGEAVRDRAVLFVSNHVSWADILVIGSLGRIAFVSKAEVGDWPLVGPTARLQRTVFVDRTRRQRTGEAVGEIVKRLTSGVSVVLFAEGTSSDGNRVLPFRSALIGAIRDASALSGTPVTVQPMSICYTGMQGLPMGRQHRTVVAWYGDLDFMPHIKTFIERGAVDATVTFDRPFAADAKADRKAMSKSLENAVRRLTTETLRGRPPALQSPGSSPNT